MIIGENKGEIKMKESIIKLCNEIIDNNGVNSHKINCSGIDCEVCPFEGIAASCQELTPTQNIGIAKAYLNKNNEPIPTDKVNHPGHYNVGTIEVITVIEDWKLNFNLGNAIKYIGRCEHKNNKKEDIKKAIWYLERELKNNE